uniref:Uncharacterized protein n=1 Tax=Meloidogyne enterolobii TaxID=390850 RepID=A0A6V7XNP8_MELEN|nr:unnamed protein product [Meloidogyne enterolobii]
MSCSAIFILDQKGNVIMSRNFRGDIDVSVIEKFMPLLVEQEDEGRASPIIQNGELSYVFIKHMNIYC